MEQETFTVEIARKTGSYDKRFVLTLELTDRDYLELIKCILDFQDELTKEDNN